MPRWMRSTRVLAWNRSQPGVVHDHDRPPATSHQGTGPGLFVGTPTLAYGFISAILIATSGGIAWYAWNWSAQAVLGATSADGILGSVGTPGDVPLVDTTPVEPGRLTGYTDCAQVGRVDGGLRPGQPVWSRLRKSSKLAARPSGP